MSRPKIKRKVREQFTRLHAGERCPVCGRAATKALVLELPAHEQTLPGQTMGLSVAVCDRCGYDENLRAEMNRAADDVLGSPVKVAHVLHDNGGVTKCVIGLN